MTEHEAILISRLLGNVSYLDFQLNNATDDDLCDLEGLREACSRFLDRRQDIVADIKALESSLTRTIERKKQLEDVTHVK